MRIFPLASSWRSIAFTSSLSVSQRLELVQVQSYENTLKETQSAARRKQLWQHVSDCLPRTQVTAVKGGLREKNIQRRPMPDASEITLTACSMRHFVPAFLFYWQRLKLSR
ncbi:uncharacterized protein LOC103258141 [Carlito syrichta]|uniref:Uncharacterized protein LOC103258141 n=1 Tax=Carlito syrichta TaxID=1868482 RepID=A0A3Q0DWH8_CARSF|nr:uncharacterized protein LOC103258141 [Carlito syrichta]